MSVEAECTWCFVRDNTHAAHCPSNWLSAEGIAKIRKREERLLDFAIGTIKFPTSTYNGRTAKGRARRT